MENKSSTCHMTNEKRLIELGEALRMVQNSKQDCPEASVKGRAIWETAHNCALSCLISCNAVDAVEVVHGRWERRVVDWSAPYSWKVECSNCGFDICGLGDAYLFKYCPNCGAKMDGGNEDG